MRGQSHKSLGRFLAQRYMEGTPKLYIRAFLIGCIEPDRNPTTYLKGSMRAQWLRGHNWKNSERYIQRVANRLERKAHWHLWQYYAMGRLIHYVTDAFTSAHNSYFNSALTEHRSYEVELQNFFLEFLAQAPQISIPDHGSVIETIRQYHRQYSRKSVHISTDSQYAFQVSSMVVAKLLPSA